MWCVMDSERKPRDVDVDATAAGTDAPAVPPQPPNLLTVAEVAAMMRVSKMTVYRLVHDGRLPALQVGRSFRIPRAAIDDYLRDAYVRAG
jgi:excisionase family DNA binding protein